MKAVEISKPGAPDVLKLTERPKPALKTGEVLIKVAAAGVNRPDVLQRQGHYPVPAGASDLPGLEIAGTIVEGDLGDSGFTLGSKVCALVQGGGYAEYCAAPVSCCLPIPRGLSEIDAASLPETFFTVWSNVFDRAGLKKDESLLVQGGSSGIGVTAIQLAHAMGHRVYATAGTAEKVEACHRLGADRAINYKTEDFVTVIRQLTQNRGVDVILDMVAGSYVPREIECLADDGRLVLIALLGGAKSEVDLSQILRRRLALCGSTLRPRPVEFKAAIAAKLKQHVWPLLENQRIKPEIFRRFALDQASAAHSLMESGEHIGKIVLEVSV
jgi:NADPH2:quinone reductase